MAEKKTELVSFRATPTFKVALKAAAEGEKRSQADFLLRSWFSTIAKSAVSVCRLLKFRHLKSRTLRACTPPRPAPRRLGASLQLSNDSTCLKQTRLLKAPQSRTTFSRGGFPFRRPLPSFACDCST